MDLLTHGILWLIIFLPGEVLELADRHDLGSCAERREGSSPSFPTIHIHILHFKNRTHDIMRRVTERETRHHI